MRRVGTAVAVAFGLIVTSAPAAFAAPAIPVPAPQKPTTVCTISSDSKGAIYLTGLVATKDGYVSVDESNAAGWPLKIVYLNSDCTRNKLRSYSGSGARDPEDIAVDKNGTMWVADIGDPAPTDRPTIALWKVPASGSTTLYHFKYPDGPHPAKAMVLDGDDRPIFITQPSSGSGAAGLYEPPVGPLDSAKTPTLTKVGTFTPEDTGTDNKLEGPGRLLVTGGAKSPDGTKVVLRTYSDAYEWTVTGGAVVSAITGTKPIITPMPDEAQGEAIAFTTDGKSFLTVSNSSSATPLLKYTPATAASATKAPTKSTTKALAGPKQPSAIRKWVNSLSLLDLQLILAGVGVFGLILVAIGVLGIRRSRAARASAPPARPSGGRPEPARAPVGAASGGGVYGGSSRPVSPPPAGGNVYGGSNVHGSTPPRGGGVYGGAPVSPPPAGGNGGGGVYGAPRGGNQGGGVYGGNQYGAPVDPYDSGPNDRRRPDDYR